MSASKITVVVPTIRQSSITPFLAAWEKEFKQANVIVVEDNPRKSFILPKWVTHFCWEDIDKELGKDSWVISRRNAGIRSFGFLKAWKNGAKYIVTLDDDCLPEGSYPNGGFLEQIISRLNTKWDSDQWWNTTGGIFYPRGYPYKIRKIKQPTVIHHGLWSNIPDLDGITQKRLPNFRTKPFNGVEKVPFGKFFTMSTMNLAFKREITPVMYLLLMGENNRGKRWGYDRFDDIWAGLLVKKICDHLGLAISSGSPSVKHTRASNVDSNIEREKTGMIVNEWLWKKLESVNLRSSSTIGSYKELANFLEQMGDSYWGKLSDAMKIWVKFYR